MVTVRPTVRTLKKLHEAGKLPEPVATAYGRAKSAVEVGQKVERLAEAVSLSMELLPLVTYAQKRFDQNIFERWKSVDFPVFETRERDEPVWRGAVVHPDDEYAWLIYVEEHDLFHKQAGSLLRKMRTAGTLGPDRLDWQILDRQKEQETAQNQQIDQMRRFLKAIEAATALGGRQRVNCGAMHVEVELETAPFEEWDLPSAHKEIDLIKINIPRVNDHWHAAQSFLKMVLAVTAAEDDMVEQTQTRDLKLLVAVSRAQLASYLDYPVNWEKSNLNGVPEPKFLHYSAVDDFTESLVTGRVSRAVCGKWWVPIGDESTHSHLPVCPDCESELPAATLLRNLIRDLDR